MDAAQTAGIQVLVTCDQNIAFQQSLVGRRIAVVVLATNRWAMIRTEPRRIADAVAAATPGSFTIIQYDRKSG